MPTDPLAGQSIRLSNGSAGTLALWLEPWCDEIDLAPRAELAIVIESDVAAATPFPVIEPIDERLAIYAAGATRLRLFIDGVAQETGSAVIAAPDFGPLSAKEFVDIVFAGHPGARPAGAP